MRELARNWLDYAKLDLQAAEQLVSQADLTALAAFHCQQCIEKSLKGLLELHDQSIPRIHDLVTLHERVKEHAALEANEEMLLEINDTYIDSRYPQSEMPASAQSPSLSKASEFVKFAKQVYQIASRLLVATPTEEE